jgi:hypothetical protein
VNATAPSAVFARAASGISDPALVVVEVDPLVGGVDAVLELAVAAEVDDSAGRAVDVVQADVRVASATTTATATHLNPRPTLHPLTHS